MADVSQKAIANVGWADLGMVAPVFSGDTTYAESEVLSKHESRSHSTQGIVVVRTSEVKADGIVFMTYERTILVPRRGHGVTE